MFKVKTISSLSLIALLAFSLVFSANAASAPNVSNLSVDVTGPHNILINVSVNPNGSPTNIYFKYFTSSQNYPDKVYYNLTGTSSINVQNWGVINLMEGT